MELLEEGCLENDCTASAFLTDKEWLWTGAGFGPRGTKCIVAMGEVWCAAGHHYWIEVDSLEIQPDGT